MEPKFKTGDKVKMVAFTDCFNEYQPEARDLIVADVREVKGVGRLPDWFSVTAIPASGFGHFTGHQGFFTPESM